MQLNASHYHIRNMVYSQICRLNIVRRASTALVAPANGTATRATHRVLQPRCLRSRQVLRTAGTSCQTSSLTNRSATVLHPFRNTLQQQRYASTATAPRQREEELEENAGVNGNDADVMTYGKRVTQNFVETSLSRIDTNVKRFGRVPLQSFKSLMRGILEENTAEDVTLTPTHALLLLRCCGSLLPEMPPAQRTETVNKLWQHLKKVGLRLDVSHYNAYLKALLENGAQLSPVELLANMERDKIEPNRVTYQRIIAYYCQQGDIEATTKILEFMKSKDMPINEYVFRSLIQGHARAKDMPNAEKMLEVMRAGEVEPDAVVYAALLEGYAANGQMDKVRETLQTAAEKYNVNLSHRELLAVIKAFALNGHLDQVQDVIGIMPKIAGYSQDCMNTILELVNAGAPEAAYKLLLTLTPPEDDVQKATFGILFLRQLVLNSDENNPDTSEMIIRFCEDLRSSQFNPYAFQRACEIAVQNGKAQIAAGLLRKMHQLGMPIRSHYFWPLLARLRADSDAAKSISIADRTKDLWDLTNLMHEFGMSPSLETVTDYILPVMAQSDPEGGDSAERLVEELRPRVGARGAVLAVVRYKLRQGDLAGAADLWERYEIANTNPDYLWRVIAEEVGERKDAVNGARLFSLLLQRVDRSSQQADWHDLLQQFLSLATSSSGGNEQFAVDLVAELSKRRIPVTPEILRAVFEERYGQRWQDRTYKDLARAAAQSRRGNIFDADLGDAGRRDTTMGMMRRQQQQRDGGDGRLYGGESETGFQHVHAMDVEALQAHLIELESKGMSTRGVLRRLVLEYARLGQLDKMEEIKKRLDAEGFVYSAGMLASLMETYVRAGNLDKALEIQQVLREQYPEFRIDGFKVLNLAALLVRNDRLSDAVDAIAKAYNDNDNTPLDIEAFDRIVFRLLNTAAERGDAEAVDTLWEALNRYTNMKKPTALIAGPFVKVHVMRNDWDGAMRAFERCVSSYRLTPWKNELMKHFIQEEDAASLQRLLDLSITVYGELNSLYDLAFCFLELGRKKQAEKIFDTPGMRARQDRLESFCDTFVRNGALEPLQSLMQVTRNLFDIDRDAMYYHLIRGYRRAELVDQALPVWTDMQEEGVQPSARTMRLLALFLKENNREVPFSVPEDAQASMAETAGDNEVQQAIRQGDARRAIAAYRRSGGQGLSIRVRSNLIELLAKSQHMREALAVTHDMLDDGNHPFPAVFKFLLTTLNNSGDVYAVRSLAEKLPQKVADYITTDQHLFDAYVNAGRADEILQEYEKLAASPKLLFSRSGPGGGDDNQSSAGGPRKTHLSRGALYRLLERHPEFEKRVHVLGDKLAQHGMYQAIQALWEFYYTQHRFDDARRLSTQYPDSIRMQRVIRVCVHAKAQNDADMLRTLIEDQLAHGNRDNACIAYSWLIGLLTHNGEYDVGLKVIEELQQRGIRLEELRSAPLRALHAALKQQSPNAAEPPFQVPEESPWARGRRDAQGEQQGGRGRRARRGGVGGDRRNYDDLSAADEDQALLNAENAELRGRV